MFDKKTSECVKSDIDIVSHSRLLQLTIKLTTLLVIFLLWEKNNKRLFILLDVVGGGDVAVEAVMPVAPVDIPTYNDKCVYTFLWL